MTDALLVVIVLVVVLRAVRAEQHAAALRAALAGLAAPVVTVAAPLPPVPVPDPTVRIRFLGPQGEVFGEAVVAARLRRAQMTYGTAQFSAERRDDDGTWLYRFHRHA